MDKKVIAIGIGAFAVGAVGGYILGYKTTVKKLEDWANEEIQRVRAQYRQREAEILEAYNAEGVDADDPENKTGVFSTVAGAAEILLGKHMDPDQAALAIVGKERVSQMMVDAGYEPLTGFEDQSMKDKVETAASMAESGVIQSEELGEVTGEDIVKSIWQNTAATGEIATVVDVPEEEPDGLIEFIPKRHPDRPYVVPEAWYMGEDEYEKEELVYYEEDGVLVGANDVVVTNKEEIVGEQNLHKFGIGTTDRNAVYVRNEPQKTDFEIIRDKRSYTQVVLNVKPARETSGPLKMRDDGE